MNIVSLIADLQARPNQIAVYRAISAHYKSCNRPNEAQAFDELIRKKFNDNDPNIDQEQRKDDTKDSGID